MKPPPTDLLCASANPMLLDGLRHLVGLGNFRILGEVRNVTDLLSPPQQCNPAIVILDLDLTARESNLIQKCRLTYPGAKVVLIQGNQVNPNSCLEIPAADAFLNAKQSMATLVKQLEALSWP